MFSKWFDRSLKQTTKPSTGGGYSLICYALTTFHWKEKRNWEEKFFFSSDRIRDNLNRIRKAIIARSK